MPKIEVGQFLHTPLTEYSNENVTIYLVDGSWIRNPQMEPTYQNFTEGGNDMAYDGVRTPDFKIPPGEVWIDLDVAPNEVRCTVIHELTERRVMINDGIDYDTAHENYANPAEENARMNPEKIDELLQAELKIAPKYKPIVQANTQPPEVKSMKTELKYKTFRANVIKYDDSTGIIDMLIPMNSGQMDRSDEVCLPKSWEKRLPIFMKRPILVSSHTYDDLRKQIGEFVTLKVTDEGLMGTPRYYINDGNPEADWAYKLAKRGMAAFSVGFKPYEMETAKKDGDPAVTYTDSELYEISQVVVPCDRNAIQNSIGKSANPVQNQLLKDILADKDLIEKVYSQDEIADEIDYLAKMIGKSSLSPENLEALRRLTVSDMTDNILSSFGESKDLVKCKCDGCATKDCKCTGKDCKSSDCTCKCHSSDKSILNIFQK